MQSTTVYLYSSFVAGYDWQDGHIISKSVRLMINDINKLNACIHWKDENIKT